MDEISEKDRINKMIDAVMRVARGDYSVQIECSSRMDELDSLAIGINMMVNDIERDITKIKQFERELISERTKAGLAAARAKGRDGGRKPGLSNKSQVSGGL